MSFYSECLFLFFLFFLPPVVECLQISFFVSVKTGRSLSLPGALHENSETVILGFCRKKM